MLNSIVLSSDMEMLYLIDNGRAIEFPLTEQGVLVGMLNGQLSVASAVKIPVPIEEGDGREESDDSTSPIFKVKAKAILPLPKQPLFPTSLQISQEASQWTLSFNPQKGYLFAIGATDIDFDRPDIQVKSRVHIFALRKGVMKLTKKDKIININFLQTM